MGTIVVSCRIKPESLATLIQVYESGGRSVRGLSSLVRWATDLLADQAIESGLVDRITEEEAQQFLLESGLLRRGTSSHRSPIQVDLLRAVSLRRQVQDVIHQTESSLLTGVLTQRDIAALLDQDLVDEPKTKS